MTTSLCLLFKMYVSNGGLTLFFVYTGLIVLVNCLQCQGKNAFVKRQSFEESKENDRGSPPFTVEPWVEQSQSTNRPPLHPGLPGMKRLPRGMQQTLQQKLHQQQRRQRTAEFRQMEREDVSEIKLIQHSQEQRWRKKHQDRDIGKTGHEPAMTSPVQDALDERLYLPVQDFKRHTDVIDIKTHARGSQWNVIDGSWVDDIARCLLGPSEDSFIFGQYIQKQVVYAFPTGLHGGNR